MDSQQLVEGQQTQVAGFVAKTYEILNNEQFSKIVFWGPGGKQFVIKDTNKFQQIVLPKYFRHKKINSFIRQLNMYGFHKARKQNTKSIFSHPFFLKDREDLLKSIKRKSKASYDEEGTTPTKNKSTKNHQSADKQQLTPCTARDVASSKGTGSFYQMNMKSFLQSKQCINSRLNLNCGSLNRISGSFIGSVLNLEDDDESLSIQKQINEKEKNCSLQQEIKFQNPSYFFFPQNDK